MIRPYFGMGEPFLKKLSKYIIPIAYPGRTALPGECSPKELSKYLTSHRTYQNILRTQWYNGPLNLKAWDNERIAEKEPPPLNPLIFIAIYYLQNITKIRVFTH